MNTSWINKIFTSVLPKGSTEATSQGAQSFEKKDKKARLIDVTDGIHMSEEARRKSMEFFSIANRGGQKVNRPPLWSQVRKKVKGNIADDYNMDEIIDEVTEKILEAAQEDPFYKKLFR